jgi:hypothetical protein
MESIEQFVDSTSALQAECAISVFQCRSEGCEKQCKSSDEGVNPFMKLCNPCSIILRVSLEEQIEETTAAELPVEPKGDTEDFRPPELECEGDTEDFPPPELECEGDDAEFLSPELESEGDVDGFPSPAIGEATVADDVMTMEDISTSLRLLVQACDKRLTADIRLGKLTYCCFKIKTAVIQMILHRQDADSVCVHC